MAENDPLTVQDPLPAADMGPARIADDASMQQFDALQEEQKRQQDRDLARKSLDQNQIYTLYPDLASADQKAKGTSDAASVMLNLSYRLNKPLDEVRQNFQMLRTGYAQAQGWDVSSSDSVFKAKFQEQFQKEDDQQKAIQNLQAKALQDSVSYAGKGMSRNPLAAFSEWDKEDGAIFGDATEAQKLKIFNETYLPVQRQMSSPIGIKAAQLVDALTKNADASGIPEAGADKTVAAMEQGQDATAQPEKIDPVQFLKGMSGEEQDKVLGVAAQLMATRQPEMGNGMKVAGGLGQAFAQGFLSYNAINQIDDLVDAEKRLKAAQTPEGAQKAKDDIENIKLAQKIKQAEQAGNTVQPELYGLPRFAYEAAQGVASMPGAVAPAVVPVLGEYAFYKLAQAQDAMKLMAQNPGMTAEEAKSKVTIASAAYGITMGRLAAIFGEASPGLGGFLKHTLQGTLVMEGAEAERILGRQLQSEIDPSFNPNEDYGTEWLDLLKSTPQNFVTLAAFGGMVKLIQGERPVDPNSAAELEKQAGNSRLLQYLGFTQETAEKVAGLKEGQRLKALAGEWGNRTPEQKQAGVELAREDAAKADQTLASPDAPKIEQTPDGKYAVTTKDGDQTHTAVFGTEEGARQALEMELQTHVEKNTPPEPTNDWVTSTEENPSKKPTPKEATASILQGFIDDPESAQLLQHEDGTWSVIWYDKDSSSLQYITFDSKAEALAWHEQNKGKQAPSVDTHVANVTERLGQEFGGTLPSSVEVVHEPDANWNAKIEGGKIQVNAAHVDPEQAVHEMNEELSHAAWGESGVQDLFQQLWDSADQTLKDSITQLVQRLYGDQSVDIQHEETRAKLVKEILKLRGNPESKGAWDKFVEAIKAIWEKLTGAPVTDPEAIAAKIIEIGKAKIEGVDTRTRYSLRDKGLEEKTSDLSDKDKERFFGAVSEFGAIDKTRGSAEFWNAYFKDQKVTPDDVSQIEKQLAEWKAYYAKKNAGVSQQQDEQKSESSNPIQDVLDRYNDGDESVATPADVVNELDGLAGELDSQELEDAVREYRDARRDEMEIYGERGGSDDAAFENLISVAQRIAKESETRFSLRDKERDEAYDAAVKSGDEAEQQRLVDEAAKEAGYTVKASHGSSARFTEFSHEFGGYATDAKSAKGAFFFSDGERTPRAYAVYASEEGPVKDLMRKADQAEAKGDWDAYEKYIQQAEDMVYGEQGSEATLKRRENATVYNTYLKGRFLEMDAEGMTPAELSQAKQFEEFDGSITAALKDAKEKGYDGVVIRNLDDAPNLTEISNHYAVFDPSSIKLSDPITRDDAGNVIPLSQRFNAESNDIRYSKRPEPIIGDIPPPKTLKEQAAEIAARVASTVRDLPKDSAFKRHLLQWSARSQASSNEVERVQHTIETTIKDKAKRDGITNWIEAGGDRALLLQRAAASKDPKIRAGYEAAAKFTPDEIKVAEKVRDTFNILEARAKKWGIDMGHRENYVPHVYTQEPQPPSGSSPKRLSEFFKFSQERTFESYFGGEQAGYHPQTKDISKLLGLYLNDMNNAINSRRFVAELSKGKASDGRPLVSPRGSGTAKKGEHGESEVHLVYPDAAQEGHEDYKVIDQPALHDWSFAGKDENGKNIMVKGDLAVHPEIADHFNNALGSSAIRKWWNTKTENPFLNATKATTKFLLDDLQSLVKGTMLSFSPFHQVQEGIHAIGHRVNPFANIPKIDLRDPKQADAAAHGLMLSHDRLSQSLFMEGVGTNNRNLVTMGLRKIGWGLTTAAADKVDAYQHWLFSQYIPGLKLKTYEHILERNMERFKADIAAGKATEFQVKNLSAHQANAAYGHLNYTEMGHNPTIRHAFQIVLLAPDFLEARSRFVAQSLKSLTGTKTGIEQLQAFAFLAITQVVAATIQKVLTNGDPEWDHPFEMRVGNKYYGMRSVPEDVFKMLHNPTGFIGGRISPIFGRFIQEGVFGVNYRGERTSVGDAIADIMAGIVPMPMQSLTRQWTTGGAANPISPLEQILSSAGVQVHRYSPITKVYPLAHDWVKKNYPEDVQRGSYPVSKYQQLRYALEDNDLEAAKKEVDRLVAGGMKRADIGKAFKLSVNHPFTGSKEHDKEFYKSLDEDGKQRYDAAIERRKEILRRFMSVPY